METRKSEKTILFGIQILTLQTIAWTTISFTCFTHSVNCYVVQTYWPLHLLILASFGGYTIRTLLIYLNLEKAPNVDGKKRHSEEHEWLSV